MPDFRSLQLALDRIQSSPVSTPTARSENNSPARNSGSGVSRTQRSPSSLSRYSDTACTHRDLSTQRSHRPSRTVNHSLAYWPPEDYEQLSQCQETEEQEMIQQEHKDSAPDSDDTRDHTAAVILPPLSATAVGKLAAARKELHGSLLAALLASRQLREGYAFTHRWMARRKGKEQYNLVMQPPVKQLQLLRAALTHNLGEETREELLQRRQQRRQWYKAIVTEARHSQSNSFAKTAPLSSEHARVKLHHIGPSLLPPLAATSQFTFLTQPTINSPTDTPRSPQPQPAPPPPPQLTATAANKVSVRQLMIDKARQEKEKEEREERAKKEQQAREDEAERLEQEKRQRQQAELQAQLLKAAEDEERMRRATEERKRREQEEEEERLREEEETSRRQQEEEGKKEKEEEERRREAEETTKRAEEEDRRTREEDEEARRRKEEVERQTEEEGSRARQEEEEDRKKREEEETKKLQEEEHQRLEMQRKTKAEEDDRRSREEAEERKQIAEAQAEAEQQEQRRREDEDNRRRQAESAELERLRLQAAEETEKTQSNQTLKATPSASPQLLPVAGGTPMQLRRTSLIRTPITHLSRSLHPSRHASLVLPPPAIHALQTDEPAASGESAVQHPQPEEATQLVVDASISWVTDDDRDALFEFLANEADLFIADLQLANAELDALLTTGGSRSETIRLCRLVEARHQQVETVEQLQAAMVEQRSSTSRPAALSVTASWITAADRDKLFDFLASETCGLFCADVKLNNRTLDAILTPASSVEVALRLLATMDEAQLSFETADALVGAMKAAALALPAASAATTAATTPVPSSVPVVTTVDNDTAEPSKA